MLVQTFCAGTITHCAPEAAKDVLVHTASDLHSLAVCLYKLFGNKEAWAGKTRAVIEESLQRGEHLDVKCLPRDVQEELPNLVAALPKCWGGPPRSRPDAAALLSLLQGALTKLQAV
jgi:Protein tyrosine and serine/threonine kinase